MVAVLDSGVAYERRGRFRSARPTCAARPSSTRGTSSGATATRTTQYGHGTHVAGTIAQTTNNRVGTAGIAYNAKIMPLRVLDANGEGDSAAIARAIRFAARYRADVINLSLEFPAEVRVGRDPGRAQRAPLRAPPRRRRGRRGRQPGRHHRGLPGARAVGDRGGRDHASPAARPTTRTRATTSTSCAPGGGADAPNADSAWDVAHCDPDSLGQADLPADLHARRPPLRPAALVRGHLDGGAARVRDRRAPDRDEPARRATRARAPSRSTSRRPRAPPTVPTATAPGWSTPRAALPPLPPPRSSG